MNLKDAILSTLNEIENTKEVQPKPPSNLPNKPFSIQETKKVTLQDPVTVPQEEKSPIIEGAFLHNLRERILVLFEGFQSPNNHNVEAKIDLTLNFLEHLLAQIDKELDKKGS